MTAQSNQQPEPPRKSRAKVVKAGRLPVSEFAFDRPGAASPFGDDVTFPVPVEQLRYEHPAEAEWEHTE
jgi:succinate dehydrogenase / fumarate reductase iron-sulfur subunit